MEARWSQLPNFPLFSISQLIISIFHKFRTRFLYSLAIWYLLRLMLNESEWKVSQALPFYSINNIITVSIAVVNCELSIVLWCGSCNCTELSFCWVSPLSHRAMALAAVRYQCVTGTGAEWKIIGVLSEVCELCDNIAYQPVAKSGKFDKHSFPLIFTCGLWTIFLWPFKLRKPRQCGAESKYFIINTLARFQSGLPDVPYSEIKMCSAINVLELIINQFL